MTVSELATILAEYPPDLRVVVYGYEDGFDDLHPESLAVRDIRLNVRREWYYGQHGEPQEPGKGAVVSALVLPRNHGEKEF